MNANMAQHPFLKFYRMTFWKVVAIIYTAGTVAHVLRLAARFELEDMPFFPDWGLAILGPYAVTGLVVFSGQVEYRGNWEQITHWLITGSSLGKDDPAATQPNQRMHLPGLLSRPRQLR